jgi:UDP-N-acetylmuramoyl-tripeptide--D-alanyl-D-alanine ligase
VLTLAELLAGLSFPLVIEGAERIPLPTVCIDSRQAEPGSLFVALHGEHSDGHAYVPDAFRAGAQVALVERPLEGVPAVDTVWGTRPAILTLPLTVVVPDSLRALQEIARARRLARPELRVVAVTGSVGKTTAKEAIAAVLSQHYVTLKSAGNYNNEIGLPLTLMALEPKHERVVLEMGMYALGEIAALCHLALPQVGVVTNVGPAHLERLGTLERIAQAKAELIEALPAQGIAILNGDDPRVRGMSARAKGRVVTFGLSDHNTLWAGAIESLGLDGVRFVAHVAAPAGLGADATERPLRLMALGQHAVMSALPAIAVGLLEGLSWEEIQQGLLAQGRGLRLVPKRGLRGTLLLDDTYNASPASTLAALDALDGLPGRHIAVLGDMLELGPYEAEGHQEVGQRCARGLAELVTVGQRARLIAESALEAGLTASVIHMATDSTSAIEVLSQLLQEGDALLIKGSRAMGMEAIVSAFEEKSP